MIKRSWSISAYINTRQCLTPQQFDSISDYFLCGWLPPASSECKLSWKGERGASTQKDWEESESMKERWKERGVARRRCQFLSSSSPPKTSRSFWPVIQQNWFQGEREKTCGDFRGCSLKMKETAALGGAAHTWCGNRSARRRWLAVRATNAAVPQSLTHS